MRSPALLLLLTACATEADPAVAYVEAARRAPTDPAGAAATCRTLTGEVRAECLTLTAHAAAPGDPAAAGALCAEVAAPFWQDECWFLVAEASAPAVGGARAVQTCAQAGRFRGNCLDHVWRAHATSLLASQPPEDAAAAFAPALAWAEGLVDQKPGQLRGRFWQKFYDAPLHDPSLPALDLAWCDRMEGEPAARCGALLPAAFRHTLVRLDREQAMQGGPARPAACDAALPLPDRVKAAYDVRYVAHPTLDALAQRQLAARCRR